MKKRDRLKPIPFKKQEATICRLRNSFNTWLLNHDAKIVHFILFPKDKCIFFSLPVPNFRPHINKNEDMRNDARELKEAAISMLADRLPKYSERLNDIDERVNTYCQGLLVTG